MIKVSSEIIQVASGETSTGLDIEQWQELQILNEGVAYAITASGGGSIVVSSGGILLDCEIGSGGSLTVLKQGYAQTVSVKAGGMYTVSSGGQTRSSVIMSGGTQVVLDDVSARAVTVMNGGELHVSYGAYADAPAVSSGGLMIVSSGGMANKARISGSADVTSGGELLAASILSGGQVTVQSKGFAESAAVNPGGVFGILNGGKAVKTVENGGWVYVEDGANVTFELNTIIGLVLANQTSATVHSGTTATDVTVNAGGKLEVFSGGMLAGRLTFENGATVSMDEGAVAGFDLTKTEAETDALVNDLSIVQGTPVYTLTVDGTEAEGMYALADGAAEFAGTISVVNASGESFGILAVGETVKIGEIGYTLNLTDSLLSVTVREPVPTPEDLVGTAGKISWKPTGTDAYVVEYSMDDFRHVISVLTTGNAVDTPDLPAGTYQWRVRVDAEYSEWAVGEAIVSETDSTVPKVVRSNEDGSDDLFFATPDGVWGNIYFAQHVGSVNDGWGGTNEIVSANEKGRIQNLFFGSSDPNVLCLTDSENGDAIFVDDVFTELPESIAEHTARLFKIQEIRAGAGSDIVDMTSQKFEYTGGGLTIRGGDGNDIIWANTGDNHLFGDDGNDRIVGASGNDVIAGGIGNDRLHGGGGEDVFTFCDNWGSDNVEQLSGGSVTLWFTSGSETNWNAETMTYSDGTNSVKVSGVSEVRLKFGDDGSAQFASLTNMGAFFDATTERIFEESGKGILASL